MNFIEFNDNVSFSQALTSLEMEATPAYTTDIVANRIYSDMVDTIANILNSNGIVAFDVENLSDEENDMNDDAVTFRGDGDDSMDGDHASALASVYGDNEDYGMAAYDDITCLGDE